MKLSELTPEIISEYVHIDPADPLIPSMTAAAGAFVKSFTGLSDEEIDEHEDITIAALTIIADMYDQRTIQVVYDNVNWTAISILSLHADNYLPLQNVGDDNG